MFYFFFITNILLFSKAVILIQVIFDKLYSCRNDEVCKEVFALVYLENNIFLSSNVLYEYLGYYHEYPGDWSYPST